MDTPEIKIIIPSENLISAETKQVAIELLAKAKSISLVTTAEQNQDAGRSVVALRKHSKAMDASRMEKTRKLDDAKKIIKDYFDEHCAPMTAEIDRLQRLGTAFVENENRRVAAEEKKRRDEFEAAQRAQFALDEAARKAAETGSIASQMLANRKLEAAKANVQTIIAAPEPEANKAKGQQFKQVLKWEVTDIFELVKARPDLCRIEANASAIKATCHPNLAIPGLRLWMENEAVYTTR